jgi:hypothetical protein
MRSFTPSAFILVSLCACGGDGASTSDTTGPGDSDAADVADVDTAAPDAATDTTDTSDPDAATDTTDTSDPDAAETSADTTDTADTEVVNEFVPEPIGLFSTRKLAAYENEACAVVDEGVACWGDNGNGELGFVGTSQVPVAVAVADAVSVGVGNTAACAVTSAGTVYCWGGDTAEGLGGAAPGTIVAPIGPTLVPGIEDAREVVGNWHNFCVRHATGAVSCWGDSSYRVLGATTTNSEAPVVIAAVQGAVELEAAHWSSVEFCARLTDGGVICWGALNDTPRDMGLAEVTALESVCSGFCALIASSWHCWGPDVRHATTGVARALSAPTVVADYADFEVLGGVCSSGSNSTMCGFDRQTSTLSCAGNVLSQVTAATQEVVDAEFVALTSFGWTMVCGITAPGDAQCLGSRALGNSGTTESPTLVDVEFPN